MPDAAPTTPVLYLVACAASPAVELAPVAGRLRASGWDVCVISTPSATRFLDVAELARITGRPVRSEYKHPDEPDVLPPADVFAVAPATFNTVNKWAAGVSDTLALGLLNEGLGGGKPIVAAPWPNADLARHPAFGPSVDRLRASGVRILLDPDRLPGARPGTQEAAAFPWQELEQALADLADPRMADGARARA
jgi:phosphopantothenoylcysteine synthetase/decarboxylase